MFVNSQSFHLDQIQKVSDNFLKKGEKRVVRHDAKHSLSYANLQIRVWLQHIFNWFVGLVPRCCTFMTLAPYRRTRRTRVGTTWIRNISQGNVNSVLFWCNSRVFMNSNTNTEQSFIWIYVVQQLIFFEVITEIWIRTLEIENKTFQICVAKRHQLNCFFLCL